MVPILRDARVALLEFANPVCSKAIALSLSAAPRNRNQLPSWTSACTFFPVDDGDEFPTGGDDDEPFSDS